jgi:hypothetical protein
VTVREALAEVSRAVNSERYTRKTAPSYQGKCEQTDKALDDLLAALARERAG